MKVGVLFSGGKDSTYAMLKTEHEVVCLISIISENKESYMFHVPNVHLVDLQAQAMNIPLIKKNTKGIKEKELDDLKDAIKEAKVKYNIEGIITGAVESVYQSSRIEDICQELKIKCINPLWKIDQVKLLNELIENNFEIIISGIFAYGLDKKYLGKKIDDKIISKLVELKEKYNINPAGEGGEIETTVLNCPLFRKKINIIDSEIIWDSSTSSGEFIIKKAELIDK